MSALNAIPYDTNVSNFVSVKLSDKQNYFLWKAQMLCLLNSVNVCGIVDDTFVGPRSYGPETVKQYDNLVRGWIFGSVSEVVLKDIYNLDSAKAVWKKLQSNYDPPMRLQEDSADAKTETEDINVVSREEGTISIEVVVPTETETKKEDTQISEQKIMERKKLKKMTILKSLTLKGDWSKVESMIREDYDLATSAISSDGSTILHIAVGIGHNVIVKNLIEYLNFEKILQQRDSDGSTALHIAAIVGNKDAAKLLVEKNSQLLVIKDRDGEEPLHKAYKNMHLDTIAYLLQAVNDYNTTQWQNDKFAVSFLVNAISAKQYSLALKFVQKFPKAASSSDEVLMTIAKTFPSGLDDWEKLFYPSLHSALNILRTTALLTTFLFVLPVIFLLRTINDPLTYCKDENESVFHDHAHCCCNIWILPFVVALAAMIAVPTTLASALAFICLLILIIYFIFLVLYGLWWKGAKILAFPPIKKIENKIKEQDEAKKVLERVCDEIDELNHSNTSVHCCYARPIIKAACQNAYIVVDEILTRSPESIDSLDGNGFDIIQLAIIHRSEKIYNLIYDFRERKNRYRTYKDSLGNNLLHLAAKLAPSSVLNQRTGATLQLQRELQWHEEVKKLVIPTFITAENKDDETPDMVFTREHKNLVEEAEEWLKTTAESCSITAALIITIVFAAAITVPGGSNQEKGTPLFKKEVAFIIFAISDAISLFASSTALLVFLSILTTRFAEKDFLVSLPIRLFFGLFTLLLSTTSMMVAFSATLFLVFCEKKLWMLAPICGLAFIPIASFVGLQFPLMVDLFKSAYLPIFGKKKKYTFKDLIRMTFDGVVGFGCK